MKERRSEREREAIGKERRNYIEYNNKTKGGGGGGGRTRGGLDGKGRQAGRKGREGEARVETGRGI